ncbi:hypothetical protein CQY20_13975 [Mycolicibacterium agri]|nr:DUF732 domain-containing protein [Mycolicibacterium agri]PEG38053.1 hypothetical protein CQY20_13975 [Mycolicibacterium agri]
MRGKRLISTVAAVCAVTVPGLGLAAPALADPDTDFYNELHTYGIYGQKDYNAWIGKLACKRLHMHTDADVYKSSEWILKQLDRESTTAQAWQFLGAAMRTYCPDQLPLLQNVAQPPEAAPAAAPAGPALPAEQ